MRLRTDNPRHLRRDRTKTVSQLPPRSWGYLLRRPERAARQEIAEQLAELTQDIQPAACEGPAPYGQHQRAREHMPRRHDGLLRYEARRADEQARKQQLFELEQLMAQPPC